MDFAKLIEVVGFDRAVIVVLAAVIVVLHRKLERANKLVLRGTRIVKKHLRAKRKKRS